MNTITVRPIDYAQQMSLLAYIKRKKMIFEISETESKKSELDQALEDLENGNTIHYGTVEEFSNRIDKYFV